MGKKILVVACLVVATAVFSGCGLLGKNKNQEATKEKTNVEQKQENKKSDKNGNGEESFFGSMQDLLARGKSLKCTYKTTSSGDEYETVMYIAGGKVKTETEVKTDEGKTIENSMVIDKDWMYTWNSFTPKGMKVDMSKMPEMDNVSDDDINKDMASMAKNMDYKCRAWIPDNSKFKIPTNIQFQDITEMMAGMTEGIMNMTEEDMKKMETESNKWICEHCKTAPTPELKAECLGDVKCD